MEIYILLSVYVVISAWAIATIVRLARFSAFLSKEIDRVFEARIRGDKTASWPDVKKCYNNFKLHKPFDYNFQRMMVYDRTR